MIKLLKFLTAKKSFLLFVLLELVSIVLIINAHNYAQTKTHNWQTAISGSINNKLSNIKYHFYLQEYNDSLLQQNARLLKSFYDRTPPETSGNLVGEFEFIPAYVVSNQYKFVHNTLLINKGQKDGVQPEMGVIAPNGIVGIVQKTSGKYAQLISVLNKSTKLSVALKHTNYTGFLQWNGQNPNIFSIEDLPVNAPLKIGDTIVTGGVSTIFPKGIPVGIITDFITVPGQKNYKINIKTFMDYTNIGPVYVVKNNYKQEVDSLKSLP